MAVAKLLEPEDNNPLVEFHGSLRIRGTRVPVEAVIYAFREGASAEEIVAMYPTLPLPDVYAAISLYLRRKEEMDAYVERREREDQDSLARIEEQYPSKGLRDQILKKWSEVKGQIGS